MMQITPKQTFYRDKLLFIMNRGGFYRLDKCLCLVHMIITNHGQFFNQNDLNLILDILIRELQTNTVSEIRISVYKVLYTSLNLELYK